MRKQVNQWIKMTAVFCVGMLIISSCASKKSLVKDADATKPAATTPSGQVKPQTDARQLEALKKNQFAEKVLGHAVYVDNITSKIDFTINTGSKEISVSGKIQMRRDDVIRIQLSVPFLGMEAGRLEFTKDYVMIVDRIHTEYVKGDYNKVDFLKNNGLDFYALQALFWNQLYIPGEQKVTQKLLSAFVVDLKEKQENSTLSLKRDNMSYVWQAENATGLIKQVDVQYNSKQSGSTKLKCTYGDFRSLGVKQYPADITLDMNTSATQKARRVTVNIRMKGLNTDSKWDARTTLSNKYTEVSVDDVLKKLMSF
ncbi:MAG: DUF4292 domain-containing protein [Prevotella sp.]|nr:DUF4292 domain-containing protein [Prevotella sp.]